MASRTTYQHRGRLAVRGVRRDGEVDGAWWPRTQTLGDELPELFAAWPTENGHITQVLYSLPDWVDRPSVVAVPRRRAPLRTSGLTHEAPRTVILVMLDGSRWSLAVIPPATAADAAARRLSQVDVRR